MKLLTAERGGRASVRLDIMRALAAVAVVVGHTRSAFLLDAHRAEALAPLEKVFYLFSGLGHQAVIIFFVLSGFFVGASALAQITAGRFQLSRYLVARLSRLYPALLVCLALGWLLDSGGIELFGEVGLYPADPQSHVAPARIADRLDGVTFLGNALFLQTIVVEPLGSNGPLWSLANEWWYYLAFPLLLALFRPLSPRQGAPLRVVSASIGAVILVLVGAQIAAHFPVWLLGVGLALVVPKRWPSRSKGRLIVMGSLVLLGAALFGARIGDLGSPLSSDYVLSAATAIVVWAILTTDGAGTRLSDTSSAWTRLAGFSYTLYILHFPIVAFLRAWITPDRLLDSTTSSIGLVLGVVAVTMLLSWAVATMTEERTPRYRAWLQRVVDRFSVSESGR